MKIIQGFLENYPTWLTSIGLAVAALVLWPTTRAEAYLYAIMCFVGYGALAVIQIDLRQNRNEERK